MWALPYAPQHTPHWKLNAMSLRMRYDFMDFNKTTIFRFNMQHYRKAVLRKCLNSCSGNSQFITFCNMAMAVVDFGTKVATKKKQHFGNTTVYCRYGGRYCLLYRRYVFVVRTYCVLFFFCHPVGTIWTFVCYLEITESDQIMQIHQNSRCLNKGQFFKSGTRRDMVYSYEHEAISIWE